MSVPPATKLVIFGDGLFAEIACQYFTHDSPYEVVAFSVEGEHQQHSELQGLPVVPFEELEQRFAPEDHNFHAAVTYSQLNRLRARISGEAKERGYALASYVSSRAFVWRNVEADRGLRANGRPGAPASALRRRSRAPTAGW
jgi:hypothetical protein